MVSLPRLRIYRFSLTGLKASYVSVKLECTANICSYFIKHANDAEQYCETPGVSVQALCADGLKCSALKDAYTRL
jgi:hypothetical protein